MKFANIVHGDELVNHIKLNYVNYYSFDNTKDIDLNLPTLLVGWSFVKTSNFFSKDINILEKRIIKSKLYWEFSFTENKSSHINGVSDFVYQSLKFYFFENYKYLNLDVVIHNIQSISDIQNNIPEIIHSSYIYKNEMAYILSNKKIIGIDLNMYSFFGFDIKLIVKLIESRSNLFFNDADGEIYQKYYRMYPNFPYLKRYMVSFLTK